jgi:hypothetical protein
VFTVVLDGAEIVMVGAIVSFTPVGVKLAAAWRVTETTWETLFPLFVAVMVIEFAPTTSPMLATVQAVPVTCAEPDAPFADQVTVVAPVPPETVPLNATVAEVPGAAGV